MKRICLTSDDMDLDFKKAQQAADTLAGTLLGECDRMSWYDRVRDREAPAHVSECHDDSCELPGYVDYARNRGAELMVDVGEGKYVFCYRPLGEFAEED